MKTNRILITLIVLITFISACSPAEVAVAEPILTVGSASYTQSELEALGSLTVDYTNKDGETTAYTGVPLPTLLENAGLTGCVTLVFTAADDYQADMDLEEALACDNCIVAFDGDILRMVMPDMSGKLQVKDVVEISVE